MTDACEAKICEKGSSGGLILPIFGDAEQEWPDALRAVLYLAGLGWLFTGVAIVSEVFMASIETITSKKRRVVDAKTGKGYTYKVWNDTVSNLTLMALGSSAPEIMLSIIELGRNAWYAGDLGPSTIVGSAAFNLFMITAVCVYAIPDGEIRYIKETTVFAITATSSILAYLWLFLIVAVISKDEVTIWEGVLTFMFFPILVFIAFLADKGYIRFGPLDEDAPEEDSEARGSQVMMEMDKEELANAEMKIRKEHGMELSDEVVTKLLGAAVHGPKSKAAYRIEATKQMLGRNAADPVASDKACVKHMSPNAVVPIESSPDIGAEKLGATMPAVDCTVGFTAKNFAVKESVGTLKLKCRRSGDTSIAVSVDYSTRDGKATAKTDYEPVAGTLKFAPKEVEKIIEIKIVDDATYEDDEDFYVDLSNASCDSADASVMIGAADSARVMIIDDDMPGVLSFKEDAVEVIQEPQDKVILVTVNRANGCNGKVGCKYFTEQGTATQGYDYLHAEGEISMDDGVVSTEIPITICAKGRYEGKEEFRLCLQDPCGGAKFDAQRDGGSETNIFTITIVPDKVAKEHVDKIYEMLYVDRDRASLGTENWKEQLINAVRVSGGDDEAQPGITDYVMHVITIFWKVLFALIPPPDYCGGYLCFVISLGMIGAVTAFVGDIASLIGCVVGVPDSITAITLVALGTSLPDTFASMSAAKQDPYADASVGNVTGSNSVNVFLGLGLPWTIGAIFWHLEGRTDEWQKKYEIESSIDWAYLNQGDGKFIVVGGNLGFSVAIFAALALTCICVLLLRRRLFGGELGGPRNAKLVTSGFLSLLWVLYISLSAWRDLSNPAACS
eukprot:TRINITY_DN32889_c0_g1_i1.p1 TRINITY_DN32889_c0_g1~~TRINITY_DN32889_c0_g1_i1.p1  ORF type:complete len:844 (+),score=161.60 TRINITY_DN32889_c0_g1_i1:181-2712(+)